MSEPVAKPRHGEPGVPFDLNEIERRMRASVEPQAAQTGHDPLAELARLVGNSGEDPFGRVFGERGQGRGSARQVEPPPLDVPGAHGGHGAYQLGLEPARETYQDYSQSYAPGIESQAGHYADSQHGYAQHGYDARSLEEQAFGPAAAYDAYGQQSEQGYYAQDGYGQHDASWTGQGYAQPVYEEEAPRRTGRAKLLIAAAVIVTAGGLASAYVLRGGPAGPHDAPTILANAGPTKVQPAEPAQDGPKQTISILERGASGSTQSKVVQNEEQPVDISATARVSGMRSSQGADSGAPVTLAPPPPPPVANSLFAEPKRVKSVAVRPDGSIVDPRTPSSVTPASPAKPETPVAASATPAPAPAARPSDIASLVAATTPSATPGSAAKAPTRAEAKPAAATPAPKPAQVASVAPASTASIPAPTGAGGGFAVQIAGTTSAEEARDAVERLSRRFQAELGGYRPAVIKAEVGSKTIYRVRVRNLSSDDANTLCARLKAGGGSCFVARD